MQNVSEEQMVAIQHIIDGTNVVLDAVAGSGKSTTILSMAKLVSHKSVLQIAYNAMLRKEVEAKIRTLDIKNVKVHTFHSLAVCHYLESAHTDAGIRKIVLDNLPPKHKIPHYQIIVLDESQDMSILYFQFMVKFAFDMGKRFQLFVLGDYMQGLYEFKGADIRSLTYGHRIWEKHPLLESNRFHQCTLNTSYRITDPMAAFVNEVMLGQCRLYACKTGDPVAYLRNSRRNLEIVVISQIRQLLEAGESPGDIFVLGASVKGVNSHIRKMENALVEKGIPCYVPMFDTERIDEKITENKVVFSTFHSVKGRERKYVFVMGFDQSYFNIYSQDIPTDVCPNTLYVGCTRATQKLYLLEIDEYATDRPLEFLKKTHHEMRDAEYVSFKGTPRSIFYVKSNDPAATSTKTKDKYHDVTPTDLVKFVPEHVIEDISPILDTIFIQERESDPEKEIHIPNIIETAKGMYEDVCDLNGIAIPSIYYDHINQVYSTTGESTNIGANILKQIIHDCMRDTKEGDYTYLKSMLSEIPEECQTPADYLFLSNMFVAVKEKLMFKLKQIKRTDYVWLSEDIVSECLTRLDADIGKEIVSPPLIEYPVMQYDMEAEIEKINAILSPHFPNYEKKFRFSARIDLVTDRCIWELKCTSSISIEHKLQVVMYDWLWRIVHSNNLSSKRIKCTKPRETRILNIKTGEVWFLNASFQELTTIVVALLKGKYNKPVIKTDEEFLRECEQYISKMTELYSLVK